MQMSRRAMRMLKRHKRATRRDPGLILTSLMDIFTVLVFFLLIQHESEVQNLPSLDRIKLPSSISTDKPRQTMAILVTKDEIFINDRAVAKVADVLANDSDVIPVIQDTLKNATTNVLVQENATEREVTILGDREIPYRLLKKIMISSAQANYNNISLGVINHTQSTLP